MREKNKNPIASYLKLPQFTTMNVIDGQAGLILYASLIFYSLTIDNILNIIVLLILAGVTIAMVVGDNGILTRAKEAKSATEIAEENEKRELARAEAAMNIENTTYEGVTIPAGFAPTRIDGENKVEDGLVITDSEGNEFVWIPVDEENYKRNLEYDGYDDSYKIVDDDNYLPDGINNEKEAILKENIKGFYISRYEAGKEEQANGTVELVSKKGANVWVHISQEESKLRSKEFINNSNVKSALISGIQWDSVMSFVDGKEDASESGSKFNVQEFSPSRHTGKIELTGQNLADKVCNIYDLEGNCYEFTAEKRDLSDEIEKRIFCRGGTGLKPDGFAARRHDTIYTIDNGDADTFRFVLYVM